MLFVLFMTPQPFYTHTIKGRIVIRGAPFIGFVGEQRVGESRRRLMHLVPAPAVRLMKRRVQSRPGLRQENRFVVSACLDTSFVSLRWLGRIDAIIITLFSSPTIRPLALLYFSEAPQENIKGGRIYILQLASLYHIFYHPYAPPFPLPKTQTQSPYFLFVFWFWERGSVAMVSLLFFLLTVPFILHSQNHKQKTAIFIPSFAVLLFMGFGCENEG